MAPRKNPPPPSKGKSKSPDSTAKSAPKKGAKPSSAKSTKKTPEKPTKTKLTKTPTSGEDTPKKSRKAATKTTKPAVKTASPVKAAKPAAPPAPQKEPISAPRGRKPKIERAEPAPVKVVVPDIDIEDDDLFDEDEVLFDPSSIEDVFAGSDGEDDEDENSTQAKKRKRDAARKPVRGKKRSPTEEFLVEDMEGEEEIEEADDLIDDLDPVSGTLILDPDLIGPPAPAPLPPRPKRLPPRQQTCVDCGQQFGWLSIERVCFNCLKRRVAARKRDEDYSGYGGSDDSGGDDDY